MNKLNFNTFDLNLVRVFLALWELRSVTGAAESLNLTQPAVSHALNRLRAQFDDPLFSRIGKTMEPTTVARALHPPFRHCLEILRESTSKFDRFDPEKSVRVFHIAMSDISEAYFSARAFGPCSHPCAKRPTQIRTTLRARDRGAAKIRSSRYSAWVSPCDAWARLQTHAAFFSRSLPMYFKRRASI